MSTEQAPLSYEDMLDLFMEAFEENQDTNLLASTLLASTGVNAEFVLKAQQESSRIFAKNCF